MVFHFTHFFPAPRTSFVQASPNLSQKPHIISKSHILQLFKIFEFSTAFAITANQS